MKVWYIDRGDGEARRTQVTGDMGKVMEHYPEIVSACGEARRVAWATTPAFSNEHKEAQTRLNAETSRLIDNTVLFGARTWVDKNGQLQTTPITMREAYLEVDK